MNIKDILKRFINLVFTFYLIKLILNFYINFKIIITIKFFITDKIKIFIKILNVKKVLKLLKKSIYL